MEHEMQNNNVIATDAEMIVSRDARVAQHEAAHLTVGRALGAQFGGATINENLELGFGGMVWGPDFKSHFAGETSTSTIEKITKLMPRDGDARDDVGEIHAHVWARTVELAAASEQEKLKFGDAWPATDDRKQERALAALIFSSPEAQEAFISACAAEARAILRRHADVVDALAAALVERRTLDGAQIDSTISHTIVARQLAQEHERRRNWREINARAKVFEQQCRA
jgi:hypothetical protein